MFDGTVFPGGIHTLKYQQQGIVVACIEPALLDLQFMGVFAEYFLILVLRLVVGFYAGRPFFKFDRFICTYSKIPGISIHFLLFQSIISIGAGECGRLHTLRVSFAVGSSCWWSANIFIRRLVKYQGFLDRVSILGNRNGNRWGLRGDGYGS
jgi:hypothetical protein